MDLDEDLTLTRFRYRLVGEEFERVEERSFRDAVGRLGGWLWDYGPRGMKAPTVDMVDGGVCSIA